MLSKDRYRIKRKLSFGTLLLAVVLGALIGSAIGQAIGVLLPQGVVHDFLLRSAGFGITPFQLNLAIISFTLGFTFNLNIIGVIGIILAAYIFRWYT
ncbi:MAG TPA: DUF4321 domain-containing protein [bacterium]|nr:DUF4321 domain-containing protein [bacterium]HQG45098.1 DUF4321 domain-containing protein [bacterium]HQI49777.1 DUF4321 domain-containing protein [bacterium]HQJ64953.1 DUF4321 domain-containing protein [bacterium]